MKRQDFTTTILVDQTPKQAFDAINNVRGWWSGEIEGPTDKLGEEFTYRYKEFHNSKQKLTELIPNKKIVWLVTESSINFVKDKNEWTNTKIIFDISKKEDKTQIRFTHEGLIPPCECFDACSNAWTGLITDNLRRLISSIRSGNQDFKTVILVDQTPQEAFDAINNVRGWWSENIVGSTDKLESEFDYHYKDAHRCKIKIIELIPEQKVVWLVMDNYFNFIKDKNEWKDTRIIFEIDKKDAQTEVRFTHKGLVPDYECFDVCNEAWSNYINNSLRSLIATGKGSPTLMDGGEFDTKWVEKRGFQ
ncbi:MAG TPA: SRPBCC domain-containing protein [Chitinophagaceae bacterium]|nr:SRPBCC domain-containing protein [Chitinophagaceae bacterium]